jgi:hypothetical protein
MKKILYALVVIIAVSCKATPTTPEPRTWGGESPTEQPEFVSRIIEKEAKVIRGYRYVIVEIDGHEYLSVHEAGVVPLPKNE